MGESLNLSDGLLSSALKMSAICTFNTSLENIDKALLRKGRLVAQYEFKKLSIENSQKLIDFLGFSFKVKEEMTLAEIYNLKDNNFVEKKEQKRVGF